MSSAFPFDYDGRNGKGHPSAFANAPVRDPFKEKAERDAQKKAQRAARPDPYAKAKPPAAGAAAAAYYDPFGTPPRTVAMRPASTRTLANGAELQLVSSKAAPKPKPVEKPAVVEEEKQSGQMVRAVGGPALWVASATASATAPPAKSQPTSAGAGQTSEAYWGVGDAKRGGKGGGGSGKGSGQPPVERTFDQDDFAGVIIAIMLLLLLGWMWMQSLGSTGGADDNAPASPQTAANEPAPLPDPFGRGPVDLRPTSPIPEPQVETAQLTPPVVAPAPPAAEPAPPPATVASPAVSSTCSAEKMLRAYFCTAKSSLTPAARVAFNRQVTELKSCAGDQEIVVTGYADTRGTTEFNAQLGELRADFMADILRAEGFTVIEAVGIGELSDIEDNRNCANQRRVDISLKSSPTPSPTRACLPPEDAMPLACA